MFHTLHCQALILPTIPGKYEIKYILNTTPILTVVYEWYFLFDWHMIALVSRCECQYPTGIPLGSHPHPTGKIHQDPVYPTRIQFIPPYPSGISPSSHWFLTNFQLGWHEKISIIYGCYYLTKQIIIRDIIWYKFNSSVFILARHSEVFL